MKPDFFSIAHHEMRGMLTVIRESISIVLGGTTGPINEQQSHFLDMAEKNVDEMTRLISNVFILQRLTSGKREFDMQEHDMNKVVEGVRTRMVSSAERKGLDLTLELDGDLPAAVFDKIMIGQVITNIVSNAVEFTEKGSIRIITSHKHGVVEVSVRDTGCGINERELSKLDRRLEHSGEGVHIKDSDTGLGLAVSKEIIARHKGKIWAESEPGKGSTFHFALPIK
ncbi:MAG: hypothetical protein DRP85_07080 [Candidatus Makaraimicrobium thalassicum]|nr:MAG: hypothetical protein DRP85_07080 [Candidatus Omnitrophota bacterium]